MRISRIELCNFGSYVGKNVFDIPQGEKRGQSIVLIGGKNGAGKTTLFSGIKLCLYGNRAEGYQNVNAFYRKEIRKYFNELSKYENNAECYVKVEFFISNGQAEDTYEMKRSWNIASELLEDFESISVWKNGYELDEEAMADFDNFLLNLLPPELFELFFFDGEQIADYFLGEGGNERIKNAFMILCGYDTFDIIENNFKRLMAGKKNEDADAIRFTKAKDDVAAIKEKIDKVKQELLQIKADMDSDSSAIAALDKKYKLSGGVLYEEWNAKFLQLKDEERFREEKNTLLKKMANEEVPFIIVRNLLVKLQKQLNQEHEKEQMEILQQSLNAMLPDVMKKVYQRLSLQNDEEMTQLVMEEMDNEIRGKKLGRVKRIVNVSGEDYSTLQISISRFLELDKQLIIDTERAVDESIEKSQLLREEIERCNIEGIQNYLAEKDKLLAKRDKLSEQYQKRNEELIELASELAQAEVVLKREEKKFEEVIKKQSIDSLSERSVAFLDTLQARLFKREIERVQSLFMTKIKDIARKVHFIDEIRIDNDFGVHVFKTVEFTADQICEKIESIGCQQYAEEFGLTHCSAILSATNTKDLNEFCQKYALSNQKFCVSQEIDKSRLSKGEKQVFTMALYWAIMHLSHHEVPFIIDTPFARIDSEHRMNITKKFFMDLQGQVFIFSTNEEIVNEHIDAMKEKVQATFLLENADNIRTNILPGRYFGGENSAV